MANKISTIIDFDTTQSKAKLSDFKSAISDADGAGAKLKAGFGQAKDAIVANAGAIALGAGAALVGFGVKAVGAFTDTAKAAIDMGAAVGLSVEDSSRWIGVADDYAVSADTLQSSLGKVSKTLDETKWKDFGIATRDAGGEVRPVNDILLDTFDKLSAITNAGDRAREGAKLFGKGYAAIAPLIGHTRKEYEKMLGSVETGQVITAGEAKTAEDWRHAEDDLKDAIHNVTLELGGMVAKGAPVIKLVADIVTKVDELNAKGETSTQGGPFEGFFGGIGDVVKGAIGSFGDFKQQVSDVFEYGPFGHVPDKFHEAEASSRDFNAALVDTNSTLEHGGAVGIGVNQMLGDQSKALYDAAKAADAAKRNTDNLTASWDLLKQSLSNEQAWIDIQNSFDDVKQKGEDAWKANATGADDAAQKARDYQSALIDLRGKVIDYAQAVGGLPLDVTTFIQAKVDNGSITTANQLLDEIAHARQVIYNAQVAGHRENGAGVPQGAEGGIVPARPGGTLVNVAEAGHDEMLIPLDGKHGLNGGGNTYNINMPTGINDRDLARAIGKMIARNGPAILNGR